MCGDWNIGEHLWLVKLNSQPFLHAQKREIKLIIVTLNQTVTEIRPLKKLMKSAYI